MSAELQQAVAQSADASALHANVPTLLLELQTLLGALTTTVLAGTERGRRPYRPGGDWGARLGELAYGVYLLADQTNVDLETAVNATAHHLQRQAEQRQASVESGWPFEG